MVLESKYQSYFLYRYGAQWQTKNRDLLEILQKA